MEYRNVIFLFLVLRNVCVLLAGEVGGLIDERTVWTLKDSPYTAKMDVIVTESGELSVEPGVVVRFPIGLGLTVNGILRAQGTPNRRITFTRLPQNASTDQKNPSDVRLTEGSSVLEGKLQLYHKAKWRSVCTGPENNWKKEDYNIICNALGFSDGEIHEWYFNKNESGQLYLPQPACIGSETSITNCQNWKNRQMGSGKCDNYPFIGIKCKNQLKINNEGYWRGIWFNNARSKVVVSVIPNKVVKKVVESESLLQYVDIYYGGLNRTNYGTAAVYVQKVPPKMNNVTIKWSAFNGVNASHVNSSLVIENSIISENNGHGIFMNTSMGLISVHNTAINGNQGNGIHFVYHVNKFVKRDAVDFTTGPDLGFNQPYPVDILFQYKKKSKQTNFKRVFQVYPGYVLSLHFVYIFSSVENAGEVIVRNGEYVHDYVLTRFQISNKTMAASVASTGNILRIDITINPKAEIIMKMQMDTSLGKLTDLEIKNSRISQNKQSGLFVDSMRSAIHVEDSQIDANDLHGINIVNGTGDVNVTKSMITNNLGDGVNVTFWGGKVNVSNSNVDDNDGFGIAVWMNKTSQQIDTTQSTVVSNSKISKNGGVAIYLGHHWLKPTINITMNEIFHCQHKAIVLEPNSDAEAPITNAFITHNAFYGNHEVSAFMSPAVNVNAFIKNNLFRDNLKTSVVVKNVEGIHNHLRYKHTDIYIQDNVFQNNKGQWVVYLGLLEYSKHAVQFSRNMLTENQATNPFPHLIARSTTASVVGVASSNVDIYQNLFDNSPSQYEVSSCFTGRYQSINASFNYFGRDDQHIYTRLFDCKDGYNLACIKYQPFLKDFAFDTPHVSSAHDHTYIPAFRNGQEIGGEIRGIYRLEAGTYTVVKDVYIKPKSSLTISAGVVLQFNQSAGMMVQGNLQVHGNEQTEVLMTSVESEISNLTTSVRLSQTQDFEFVREGLLEVEINDEWGTVCKHGWGINEAFIACNQLGYVLNPDDWNANVEFPDTESIRSNILISNVKCDDSKTSLLECSYETVNDFENTCTHNDDVFVRCYSPSWSGLRIGMMAESVSINHLKIENAGQFDYAKKALSAGLQVDLLRYSFNYLYISNNINTGIQVMSSDAFSDEKSFNQLTIKNNVQYGLRTHDVNFKIQNSLIANQKLGLSLDPKILMDQRQDLARSIDAGVSDRVILINSNITITKSNLPRGSTVFIYIQPEMENVVSGIMLETSNDNIFGIQVLQPIWCNSTEEVEIMELNEDTWNIKENLSEFPLKTTFPSVSIRYKAGHQYFGGIIVYVTVVENTKPTEPVSNAQSIIIKNSQIQENQVGLAFTHYNAETDTECSWCIRKRNQSIEISNTSLRGNTIAAVHVSVPFGHQSPARTLNSTYLFDSVMLLNNTQGIILETERLFNSSLRFNWKIQDCRFRNLSGVAVSLRLPNFSQTTRDNSHTIQLLNNEFRNNQNFSFNIDGHYADVIVNDNKFLENTSPVGLITIQGMEKKMQIHRNIIETNTGPSIVTFHMSSQTSITSVEAIFKNNKLIKNGVTLRKLIPDSYTIATRGVQMINVTNNIIAENNFQYEYLSGMQISSLQTYQDVTGNWWGTTNIRAIKQKIFDFDDCSNFALAKFIPFAMSSSFIEMSKENFDFDFDIDRLSGRLLRSVYLVNRGKPYVIESDLIIMPEVSLTAEPGVTFELNPSVRILVLGSLKAQGTSDKPITFRPHIQEDDDDISNEVLPNLHVRLCLNKTCSHHGYMEMFNDTRKAWLPICDDSFTDANAKVVCRELYGRHSMADVYVQHLKRYDIDEHFRMDSSIPRMCNGGEISYINCPERKERKAVTCTDKSRFVYIYCHATSSDLDHWAGITFSVADHEDASPRSHSQYRNEIFNTKSILQHVKIIGGGMRYGTKTSCIQGMYKHPQLLHVSIADCAYHGISLVAPTDDVIIQHSRFDNNRGVGLNIISLQSIISESMMFLEPIKSIFFPYEMFGMINVCDGNKIIEVQERVFLFFKYKPYPVTCVKTFHSTKNLGFHLLALNLVNISHGHENLNVINIFDGNFTLDEAHVTVQYSANTSHASKLFKPSKPTMSVQIIADGAKESFGFIAEVFTLPPTVQLAHENQHLIKGNSFMDNMMGAIYYASIGEANPTVEISYNHIYGNGVNVSQNFSTSEAAVTIDVQNTRRFKFLNNALVKNQGGLKILAGSETRPTGLQGIIANNLFTENYNKPTIDIKGRHVSTFQEVTLSNNIITFNEVPHREVISLQKIVSIFKSNYVAKNIGYSLLFVQFTTTEIKSYSHFFSRDVYFNNTSLQPQRSSTFVAGSAGLTIHNCIFMNPENHFELLCLSATKGIINATSNWWGYNDSRPISSRILDAEDGNGKISVKYKPFLLDNSSVVEDYCPAGWKYIKKSCHLYIGGTLSESEAAKFCTKNDAVLSYVSKNNIKDLVQFVQEKQTDYDSSVYIRGKTVRLLETPGCSAIIDNDLETYSCDEKLPFLCEWGYELADHDFWDVNTAMFIVGGVAGFLVLFIVISLICICQKRRMKKRSAKYTPNQGIRNGSRPVSITDELTYVPFLWGSRSVESNGSTATPSNVFEMKEPYEHSPTPPRFNFDKDDDDEEEDEDKKNISTDTDESDENDSIDSEKKSSQESLPLVETNTFGKVKILPEKRYLETSLDDLDEVPKKRYLETSLNDLDQ